jgi:acetaldehyde dehydrogenase (acetylating)
VAGNVTGNLTGNSYGNLTGNVAGTTATFTGNVSVANLIVSANVLTTGNVSGAYVYGNGYFLSGLGINPYSNSNVAAYLPVYSGNLTSIGGNITTVANVQSNSVITDRVVTTLNALRLVANSVITSSDLTAAGNVSTQYYFGNGYYLTGIPQAYGNSNVADYLTVYNGNILAANIAAGNVSTAGNVNALGITSGNISAVSTVAANRLQAIGTGTLAITSDGDILFSAANGTGNLTFSGNVLTGSYTATGNAYAANATITGNVVAEYFVGNGYYLTGLNIPASYSNANVANYLPTYTGNLASLTGNVTTTANVQANAFTASGSGNLNIISTTGNIVLSPTGAVITTANVQANYYFGNGAFLTGISSGSSYGNSNVADYLPTYTGNLASLTGNVTTTANISAGYILGNGYFLTGLNIPQSYSNANVAAYLPTYTGNLQAGNVLINGVSTFSGNVVITANLRVDGNTTTINANTLTVNDKDIIIANGAVLPSDANGGGIIINGANLSLLYISASNTFALTHSFSVANNITSVGNITAAGITSNGNVSAQYFLGNGAFLTGLNYTNYSNTNVANYLQVLSSNVTTSANISAGYVLGNGAFLTGISGGSGNYGNSNVADYLPTYTGNLASLAGNVTTTANVSATYLLGNGAFLTGISGGSGNYGNSNVAAYLPTYTGNITANTVTLTGALSTSARTVSINTTLTATDYFVGVSAASNVTITLPTGSAGRVIVIKDQSGTLSSGKVITISGSIDNLASLNLTQPYNSVTLVYQGSQWWLT